MTALSGDWAGDLDDRVAHIDAALVLRTQHALQRVLGVRLRLEGDVDAVGADDLPADEPGLHPAAAEGDGRPGQRGHEGDHHDHDRDAPAEGPADKPVPLLHRRTQLVPGEG
jgi:hypothetical protein